MADVDEIETDNVVVTPDILDPELIPQEEPRRKPSRAKKTNTRRDAEEVKSVWTRLAENKTTVIVIAVVAVVLVMIVILVLKFWSKEPEEPPRQQSASGYPPGINPHTGAGSPTITPPHMGVYPPGMTVPYPQTACPREPEPSPQKSSNGITHEALAQHVPREALQKIREKMRMCQQPSAEAPPPLQAPSCEDVPPSDDDDKEPTPVENEETATSPPESSDKPEWYKADANRDGLCQAVTTAGGHCRNRATHGDKCGKHKNA